MRHMLRVFSTATLLCAVACVDLGAAEAPSELKIGTLYASSGRYASISLPTYYGLKFWIDEKNAEGGVYVKPFDKKIPINLIAYNDQSNTATAATWYNQLITQDKVDILVADSGSVLTSIAVPIAREYRMLLIDQSGTGAAFFSPDNPYIVLIDAPSSSIWPKTLADFLTRDGPGLGIKRVAILYATNEFTGSHAKALRRLINDAGSGVEIVYDQGVPTETSNYTALLNNIRATNPDALIELGYPANDIAFLRNVQDTGIKFKMLFTVYTGMETETLVHNVGEKGLEHVFTYITPAYIVFRPNFGLSLEEYRAAWNKKYPDSKLAFGYNAVGGYHTGLVLERALAVTDSLDQLDLRKAIFSLSGNLKTLDGTFALDPTGAQVGIMLPVAQAAIEGGQLKFVVVFPHELATGKPVYPVPW